MKWLKKKTIEVDENLKFYCTEIQFAQQAVKSVKIYLRDQKLF